MKETCSWRELMACIVGFGFLAAIWLGLVLVASGLAWVKWR